MSYIAIPVVKGRESVKGTVRSIKAHKTAQGFVRYGLPKSLKGQMVNIYEPNGRGGLRRTLAAVTV